MRIQNITQKSTRRRAAAFLAAITLTAVGLFGASSPASADEMKPVITLDGNTLANEPIAFEVGQRVEIFQLPLETFPLNRVRTTNRPGYVFGGWSYQPGGPATTTLSSSSYTSTRVFLYAVWNTKLNLDTSGATSGRVLGDSTTLDYRFGQTLTLPSGGSLKKRGFSFAGWTLAPNSGVVTNTYRAATDALGNPSLYAAWAKTINFTSRGSTGAVPAPVTVFEGGSGIALPTTAGALTRAGFEFRGWATKPRGKVITNTTAFLPKKANVTLHAVWKRTR